MLVVELPFLQRAFGTTGLDGGEWLLVAGCAATIVPVLELGKWLVRRGVLDRRPRTA